MQWTGAVAVLVALALASGLLWVRRYFAHCGPREPITNTHAIARAAAAAYEREGPDGRHRLCRSASVPIPADGPHNKFHAGAEAWEVDKRDDAGFHCLRFNLSVQYCQYGYRADEESFVAWGRCDMDEDGDIAEYSITGKVTERGVVLEPMVMVNEDE